MLTKRDQVAIRAALRLVGDERYTCGSTHPGDCWHALVTNFYGFDVIVTQVGGYTDQEMTVEWFSSRDWDGVRLFDQIETHHLEMDELWPTMHDAGDYSPEFIEEQLSWMQ